MEDERAMAASLEQALKESGYLVSVAGNGRQALTLAETHDLIVADVMMPVMNGFEMVRELRERGIKTPVLMLTAKDAVDDRVLGLDLGADDYLIKPFRLTELLARIRAVLRRMMEANEIIEYGDLWVDTHNHKVRRKNTVIYLSGTEYALLMLLLKHRGRAVSKHKILREVWDDEAGCRNLNVVEVYIKYLRAKLESMGHSRIVYTVRGMGYMLKVSDSKS